MKVGDLVRIKSTTDPDRTPAIWQLQVGIIVDTHETVDTGIAYYEVQLAYHLGWFDKFEIELLNESR
tara:strand:+ start:615 stop:815 length:201 start_codon:yes stop_codon:yes gene_type:complete